MVSVGEEVQPRETQRQEPARSIASHNGPSLYEVVGELERFDERDNVFARSALKPGSPEYEAYYARYPEREKPDSHCRVMMDPVQGPRRRAELFPEEPLVRAFSGAVGLTAYLLADHLDGPVSPERVEMEPSAMSRHLKAVGRYLGADLVGIGPLNPAWVYSHTGRCFYGGARWGDPIDLAHRYAITLGYAHRWELLVAGRDPSLASNIDSLHLYSVMAEATIRLAAYIRQLGYPARAHQVAGYQVLQVPLAIDAGMGELGRLGFLVSKRFGPSLRLVTVTTDLPLEVDPPVDLEVRDFCEKCEKCAEACPVEAVPRGKGQQGIVRGVRRWQIDAERCYRFWNARGTSCYICMSVCPWTKPRNRFHRLNAELATRSAALRSLLIWIDDLFYGRRPRGKGLPSWLSPRR